MRSSPDGYAAEHFEYAVGDGTLGRETWSRGVTLFLNPSPRLLIPDDALACTSTFRIRDGRLIREGHGFHSLTSFTVWSGYPSA